MRKNQISVPSHILNSPVQYLPGVSAVRSELLHKQLNISTFRDLLEFYPIRHVDKTIIDTIGSLTGASSYAQVNGKVIDVYITGERRSRRLIAQLSDGTGVAELVWFQGISWAEKLLKAGSTYTIFGRLSFYLGKPQFAHPEIEIQTNTSPAVQNHLEPVYSSTEKLKAHGFTGRAMMRLMEDLFRKLRQEDLPENLPAVIISEFRLMPRFEALQAIHFPRSMEEYQAALRRLKFEEFFFAQLRIQLLKLSRLRFSKGAVFSKVGNLFNLFYEKHLPFELTHAQKRVIREIRSDTGGGRQMNRLLQGDVGSGKTIVALLSMLIAAGNGFQAVLMAPTEILAQQHNAGITEMLQQLPVTVRLLTGSTPAKERRAILSGCADGSVNFVIGTHAVIEDKVRFANLGFAVVDEQHKFGVAQRAGLWKKAATPPHILVMTATPIPRTLALTAYGDLDYSVIDELPPGRKPISTVHRFETARPQVMDFIGEQITLGRQAYIVYPLIEESATLDYENLMKGFEEVKSFFPEPKFWISMVHGRQPADQKETNMHRFIRGETQILVCTTVIEVGVNVPNASVMVIESAEKFGLSQLHQLRGRVGRGADQSYCVLMTGRRISADGRERLKIMTATNDGFRIAEKDLELRGPGEVEGTRQSGALEFKLASLIYDRPILETAKTVVEKMLRQDPDLSTAENLPVKLQLQEEKNKTRWSKIS